MDGWEVQFSLYINIIFAKEIILTTLPGWIVQTSYLQQAAQNKNKITKPLALTNISSISEREICQ